MRRPALLLALLLLLPLPAGADLLVVGGRPVRCTWWEDGNDVVVNPDPLPAPGAPPPTAPPPFTPPAVPGSEARRSVVALETCYRRRQPLVFPFESLLVDVASPLRATAKAS